MGHSSIRIALMAFLVIREVRGMSRKNRDALGFGRRLFGMLFVVYHGQVLVDEERKRYGTGIYSLGHGGAGPLTDSRWSLVVRYRP